MRHTPNLFALALVALFANVAFAGGSSPYTPSAGQNAPAAAYEDARSAAEVEANAPMKLEARRGPVAKDQHGNAQGNQYDLAIDGAFEGQTVLILDQVGNTLENTKAALRQKGLNSVVYARGSTPSVKELREGLKKSTQLWLISTSNPLLSDEHIAAIKEFFDAGHGVYLWGDNDPLYVDTNRVAAALVPGLRMEGDLYADQVVNIAQSDDDKIGLRRGHLITTGLEQLYEGVTIATIQFKPGKGQNQDLYGPQGTKPNGSTFRAPELPQGFTPLLYGSAGNLVSVAYEANGKRLVVDGGFTRLAVSWDDAGTARFVKNAAAWLVNAERFGDAVVAKKQ